MDIFSKLKNKTQKFPASPGVYFFLNKKKEKIYIGKATFLKSRVRSYFDLKIAEKRSPLIEKMVKEAVDIKFEKTDSVLEALLLESELIKKFSPKYNSADKDQKSFNFVVITKEKFPRVLIVRGRELTSPPNPLSSARMTRSDGLKRRGEIKEKFGLPREAKTTFLAKWGPFPNSNQLKEALKIVRKIFPFRDKCSPLENPSSQPGYFSAEKSPHSHASRVPRVAHTEFPANNVRACFNRQIGLCPGVCTGEISAKDYAKTIRHITTFFQGKKKKLIKDLQREMKVFAKNKEFEKANKIKNQINSLGHINDIALIKNEKINKEIDNDVFRIEAYDISHISGTNMVGVMTVIENGEANKNEYRMFKIKGQRGADDTKALGEVLTRRFKHSEWKLPDIIVVDGSIAQINTTNEIINNIKSKDIALFAVTKDERHRARETKTGNKQAEKIVGKYEREIILANSEAHRFAIKFHKKLRNKDFLPPQ